MLHQPAVPTGALDKIEQMRRRQSRSMLAGFLPAAREAALEAYAGILVTGCERLALWRDRHMMDFSKAGER